MEDDAIVLSRQEYAMKDRVTDEEEDIWSAIKYLDPDEKHQDGNGAAIVISLTLALLACLIWVLSYFRGR